MGLKFRCERDVLAKALADAGRAVTTRGGALPVLAGVRLELAGDQLTITGSDLDLTISVTIEVSGSADGIAVLPSKLVSDVVRSLRSGGVDITVEDDDARIVAAPSEFAIRVIPADEFPELSTPSGDAVTLAAGEFRDAIEQVEKAASSDDARPILTGVLMAAEEGGLRLVSTDSYRLSVRDLAGTSILGEGQKVLVPSRALKELARVVGEEEEITLRLGERDAGFQVGSVSVTTRLIEGEFPNYRGLIPTNHPNQLTVDRLTLLDAVRRVRLLAQESTPVRMAMSADGLELVAVTQDVGQAHEAVHEANYSGDDLTVAFNPEYLIDGIEVAPGDEVTLETVDELKPALLKSTEDPNFLYLLMPVRVPADLALGGIMRIRTLELQDFRSYSSATLTLSDGLTAIIGENGQGKTNLLEAIGWIAGRGSFRGVPDDALIRLGADAAIVRATVEDEGGREQLIEVELPRVGRNRVQVNRQRVQRSRDLVGVVQVTVFSPDDLELVKGGPALRRRWIDEALVSRHVKHEAVRSDLERILKQRNALLRSAHGRLDTDAAFTLDVWDAKLADIGSRVHAARLSLLDEMEPRLAGAYDAVARTAADVEALYRPSWEGDLGAALIEARDHDVRRGVSSIGPHRDEIELRIGGAPARTHASQGEQRSLALALRLAADAVVREAGVAEPVLLLDDVFSELDPGRAEALLDALPAGQQLLTTAAWLPPSATPDRVVKVVDGALIEVSG